MSEFAEWLVGLVKEFIKAIWDFFTDIAISIVDGILTALLGLINLIGVPGFMGTGGFQTLFNAIPADVLYFISGFRLGECFAILGAAVAFRLARKAVTLFQW